MTSEQRGSPTSCPVPIQAEGSGVMYSLLKGEILQPRILYPARLSFRIDGEIKNSDKQKLKEFINIKPTLKEMLKGLL